MFCACLSGEGFVGLQKRWALIGTGVPGRGREHGTLSFSLKTVNRGGEGMETEVVLPTGAQPQGMSQRRRPPCSPGQWVYSPRDLSKCQELPGGQGLPRAFSSWRPSQGAGPYRDWADCPDSLTGGSSPSSRHQVGDGTGEPTGNWLQGCWV